MAGNFFHNDDTIINLMSTALDCISYTKIDDIVNVGRQYLIGTEAPISKNKSYTRETDCARKTISEKSS